MLYQQKRFTLPTTTQQISDADYEIAVGLRCADCRDMRANCICRLASCPTHYNRPGQYPD